jgi:hypothetical protein
MNASALSDSERSTDLLLEEARAAKRAKDKPTYKAACEAWLAHDRGIHVGDTVKLHYGNEEREVVVETFELHASQAHRPGNRDSNTRLRRAHSAQGPAARRALEQLVQQDDQRLEGAGAESVPPRENAVLGCRAELSHIELAARG